MEKLDARSEDLTFDIQHVNLFYGKNQALKDISMQVRKNEIMRSLLLLDRADAGNPRFLRHLTA